MKDHRGGYYVPDLEMVNITSTHFYQPETSFMTASNCKGILETWLSYASKKKKKQRLVNTQLSLLQTCFLKDNLEFLIGDLTDTVNNHFLTHFHEEQSGSKAYCYHQQNIKLNSSSHLVPASN